MAFVGFGTFNPLVRRIAEELGHTASAIISPSRKNRVQDIPPTTHVIVDSAKPDEILERIRYYSQRAETVIMATTGWDLVGNLERIREWYQHSPGVIVLSPILSQEVYKFYQDAVGLARKFKTKFGAYPPGQCEVLIEDECPRTKKDWPSGTALLLANGIQEIISDFDGIHKELGQIKIEPSKINMLSFRQGDRNYMHRVTFRIRDAAGNVLEEESVKHFADSRNHIAEGIVELSQESVRQRVGGLLPAGTVITVEDLWKYFDT